MSPSQLLISVQDQTTELQSDLGSDSPATSWSCSRESEIQPDRVGRCHLSELKSRLTLFQQVKKSSRLRSRTGLFATNFSWQFVQAAVTAHMKFRKFILPNKISRASGSDTTQNLWSLAINPEYWPWACFTKEVHQSLSLTLNSELIYPQFGNSKFPVPKKADLSLFS